ncbi:MAG: thiamine pyrophosphate-binding protein, partial [Gammaproteobacteria bacterium]|nr:thiamine pyrophosphate-binding protein [Gammaproteobacteria bacterium]
MSKKECNPLFEVGDLLLAYLNQLSIDCIFGVPGGGIEPLFNALARSQRTGGIRAVVARHETGAAFMADGYFRQTGKLGVCCATTGPGATNLLTGVASAYENQIPMLVLTGQTALSNFGKGALQESSCSGIDTVSMFQPCTRYNSLISHIDQFERKLITAIMTAFQSPPGPVHLTLPLDILRAPASFKAPQYDVAQLSKTNFAVDLEQVEQLAQHLNKAQGMVFLVGSDAEAAIEPLCQLAETLGAWLIATPHAKGLINHDHPKFCGVLGFAGHQSALDILKEKHIDAIMAIGTGLGEWASNGWDKSLLNNRLLHVEQVAANLTRSPMAKMQLCGNLKKICTELLSHAKKQQKSAQTPKKNTYSPYQQQIKNNKFKLESNTEVGIKPQWLMQSLGKLLPSGTLFLADSGNSIAWAIHYFHPPERRLTARDGDKPLFRGALEFASMGWAIGAAVGTAIGSKNQAVVCVTGDGSWLMSGQEITVAAQENLSVIFIVLNDSSLGMVKHGQCLSKAESIGHALPQIDYAAMAQAMGIQNVRIRQPNDLLTLDFNAICNHPGPTLFDVYIDLEEVP